MEIKFKQEIHKGKPPLGTTGSVICLQTLSFPRSKHFNESKAEGNCELRGTDKAHGQKNIRARFFLVILEYCV